MKSRQPNRSPRIIEAEFIPKPKRTIFFNMDIMDIFPFDYWMVALTNGGWKAVGAVTSFSRIGNGQNKIPRKINEAWQSSAVSA
jgi:hypothetical protein